MGLREWFFIGYGAVLAGDLVMTDKGKVVRVRSISTDLNGVTLHVEEHRPLTASAVTRIEVYR